MKTLQWLRRVGPLAVVTALLVPTFDVGASGITIVPIGSPSPTRPVIEAYPGPESRGPRVPPPRPSPTPTMRPTRPEAPAVEAHGAFDPNRGGRVTSADGVISVDLPPSTSATTLRVSVRNRPVERRDDDRPMWLFDLSASRQSDGTPVSRFDRPLTLTARYDPADLAGHDAKTLQFAYRDDVTRDWVPVATTVDEQSRTASAQIDHFSTWYLAPVGSPAVEIIPRSNVEDQTLDLFMAPPACGFHSSCRMAPVV